MRTAVALLASTLIFAGAAPALAGDNVAPAAGRLAACDGLGKRPTDDQIRACVTQAQRFVEAHRAMIEKARIEIRAHRADIEAAARAMRDNPAALREAEQALTESRDAIDEALRELRGNERSLGETPDASQPSLEAAPPAK